MISTQRPKEKKKFEHNVSRDRKLVSLVRTFYCSPFDVDASEVLRMKTSMELYEKEKRIDDKVVLNKIKFLDLVLRAMAITILIDNFELSTDDLIQKVQDKFINTIQQSKETINYFNIWLKNKTYFDFKNYLTTQRSKIVTSWFDTLKAKVPLQYTLLSLSRFTFLSQNINSILFVKNHTENDLQSIFGITGWSVYFLKLSYLFSVLILVHTFVGILNETVY